MQRALLQYDRPYNRKLLEAALAELGALHVLPKFLAAAGAGPAGARPAGPRPVGGRPPRRLPPPQSAAARRPREPGRPRPRRGRP